MKIGDKEYSEILVTDAEGKKSIGDMEIKGKGSKQWQQMERKWEGCRQKYLQCYQTN